MKKSETYKRNLNISNEEEIFDFLIQSLKKKITKWDYFVNWGKVFGNIDKLEIELNILNYLIGKENIKKEFKKLITKYPNIIKTIPILIASRDKSFQILNKFGYDKFEYKNFSFKIKSKYTNEDLDNAVEFASKSGFLELLSSKKITNIVDYVIGVEVGLDTNGRKNRTGKMMEGIVSFFIEDICSRNGFEFIEQATASKIKEIWNLNLTVDKSKRIIDFAIYNGKFLYLIETNFYGGVGSKLKSTAGEYKTMFDYWSNDGHKFVWITDGIGWAKTKAPLEETFNHIDYVLNLEMISKKILEDIITGNE
jgi:type II restriction enzyme